MSRQTLDLVEFRRQAHGLDQERGAQIRKLEEQHRKAAEYERLYRQTVAKAYAGYRLEGQPGNGAELLARADAAEAKENMQVATALAKTHQLRIEQLEAARATLRVDAEWSQRIDATGG